jgi:hypothetical protein
MMILDFAGLGCPLKDICYDSRARSFEASIAFACHHITCSVRRRDKVKASIFEVAALMLVG